jgi:hypothetical protein
MTTSMTIDQAQHDVREAHLCGGPGMLVSGLLWLASGAVALSVSPRAAMFAISIGGMFIFPLSMLLTRLLGRSALLARANPFGALARESAFIIPLCLPLVFAAAAAHVEWFFPALMLVVGAHYLPFVTLYGLRIYYALGLALIVAGLLLGLGGAGFAAGAFVGGAIELAFAPFAMRQALRPSRALRAQAA